MKSHNQDIDLCEIPENLIQQHQSRIRRWLKESRNHFFKIIDTCRRENTGILDPKLFASLSPLNASKMSGISAFVPAAGASSRYFHSLEDLTVALLQEDWNAANLAAKNLTAQAQFRHWALPSWKIELIERIAKGETPSHADVATYKSQINLPKALQLSSSRERSFLLEKIREHQHIPEIDHQVFIAPPNYVQSFSEALESFGKTKPWEVLAQSADLSTIRFDVDAEPVLQPDGKVSVVPAGHGALARLFLQASKKTDADVLFIRNIDNFTGVDPFVVSSTSSFLRSSQNLRSWMIGIRDAVLSHDWTKAEKLALQLSDQLNLNQTSVHDDINELITAFAALGAKALSTLQLKLFHTPTKYMQDLVAKQGHRMAISALYSRPLNILGQVRNTDRDIGGTPCFVEVGKTQVKICLEVPHASQEDKQNFLANPDRATHFNPVFAYSEVPDKIDYYDDHANDFWIIAEKKFESNRVFYHETVLYELIGNSLASNCIFVEIPRELFRPHKTLNDYLPKGST